MKFGHEFLGEFSLLLQYSITTYAFNNNKLKGGRENRHTEILIQ